MMLPFVTTLISAWFGMRGRRSACLWFWLITLILVAVACSGHISHALQVSF